MSRILLWIVLPVLMVAGMPAAPVSAKEPEPDQVIAYKTTPQGDLSLHAFLPPDLQGTTQPRAAIVFFFGGGWKNGSPKQFYPHCRHLADRGVVAFAAEYRIHSKHQTLPDSCVEDGKSAVRWIREHAAEWNINPEQIAAGGGSAGGHVAAAIATVSRFEAPQENAKISSCPNALVLFNPVLDTTETGKTAAPERLGKLAEEISPVHHLREETPPTIIFHGAADTTVPISNVESFEQAVKAKGGRCELVSYPNRAHGFFNYSRSQADYEDTVKKMDTFLESLGWFGGQAE
ncbi:MAG: alpha/beta hydrolase [Planctomycetaceae bacterium]|nr:alpha/beta hydrolase [Planctomycetaceae bacterium]